MNKSKLLLEHSKFPVWSAVPKGTYTNFLQAILAFSINKAPEGFGFDQPVEVLFGYGCKKASITE